MRRANSKCMPISCLFIYYSGALFQYFKICLISHDSVTTQSFENGGVDSACFFTESTQSPTPTPTAGITSLNEIFEYLNEAALFSCLLVNRLWHETSVQILWTGQISKIIIL